MDVKSKLLLKKKCAWDGIKGKQEKEVFDFSSEYKKFMDASKTEREAVIFIENMSLKHGFKRINSASKNETKLIISNKGVSTALCVVNDRSFKNGFNIIVAHIDAPRLDLKPITLYESEHMAYMKTHYYGGIKKYQWVTVPLALHGIIVKSDGKKINVCIGEEEGDPVFTVNDLLVHLAQEQVSKPASKVIEGEQLNILVGSIPYKFKSGSEAVKTGILEFLNKKYGINEEDLVSAELQVVPAGKARDIGFDRSFIGGYGQDDRVCAYTALRAIFDAGKCKQNLLALFLDKEEVGSTGTGGADSNLLIRVASQ
ncbi:MAG TPA: aminopeptidase, partial [bacterium]|nr:aminopeptidase [bacterium]